MRPFAPIAVALLCAASVAFAPPQPAAAAMCTNTVGPGIAPPASTPAGVPGFHAAWYGQSVHNFNTGSTASCFDATVRPVAAAVPVITTEIGTDDCSASFMNGTLGLLEQARVGYLAWTWDTWGTACGNIALIAGYDGTPTQYGSVYRAYLAAR